jgi:hypothetical protein
MPFVRPDFELFIIRQIWVQISVRCPMAEINANGCGRFDFNVGSLKLDGLAGSLKFALNIGFEAILRPSLFPRCGCHGFLGTLVERQMTRPSISVRYFPTRDPSLSAVRRSREAGTKRRWISIKKPVSRHKKPGASARRPFVSSSDGQI